MIVSDDEDIDVLLTAYEMGKFTRRQLLPARAERFYRALVGVAALQPLPVGPGAPLAFGFDLPFDSFLSFQKTKKPGPAYIDHFCIAVEADPDLGKLAKELESLGLVQRA